MKTQVQVGIALAAVLLHVKADDAWDWWRLRDAAPDAEAAVAAALARYARGWDADCLHPPGGADVAEEAAGHRIDLRTTDNLRRHVGAAVPQEIACADFSGGSWGEDWPVFGHCRAVMGGRHGTAAVTFSVSQEADGWRISGLGAAVLTTDVAPVVVPPSALPSGRDGVCS